MAYSHSLHPALWDTHRKNKCTSPSPCPIPKTGLTDCSRPSVRFLISQPPQEEMVETRSKTGLLPALKIVSTTDPADENRMPKFPSAKHWIKEHLDSLGVDFKRKSFDLNGSVMHVSNPDKWSSERRSSMVPSIRI
jgi:hypothetical protein